MILALNLNHNLNFLCVGKIEFKKHLFKNLIGWFGFYGISTIVGCNAKSSLYIYIRYI